MTETLFRPEVLREQQGSWLGIVRVATPVSHWVYATLAFSIAGAVVLFLIFGYYTQRETVSGELVPSAGLLSVSTPISGTVEQVFVQDGQKVKKGQKLAVVSGDHASPALGLVDVLIAQSLKNQDSILHDDLANQKALFTTQKNDLTTKISMLKMQLDEVSSQIEIQRQEISNTSAVLDKFESLGGNNGFVSGIQMEQQKQEVLQAKAQLKTLEGQKVAVEQQISEAQIKLSQVPLDQATQTNDILAKIADVHQELVKTSGNNSILLKAPVAGVISATIVNPGQAVQSGQSMMSLMPAGSALRAQLLVPSTDIGFIHEGSHLKLRYGAFPYQEFGQYQGVVESISTSALMPSQIAGLIQEQTKEPLYRVMVKLAQQNVNVYGHATPLRAGLQLQATIMRDHRRLIQWLFEPLYGLGRNIFTSSPNSSQRGTT